MKSRFIVFFCPKDRNRTNIFEISLYVLSLSHVSFEKKNPFRVFARDLFLFLSVKMKLFFPYGSTLDVNNTFELNFLSDALLDSTLKKAWLHTDNKRFSSTRQKMRVSSTWPKKKKKLCKLTLSNYLTWCSLLLGLRTRINFLLLR